jgi:hypothetical protein
VLAGVERHVHAAAGAIDLAGELGAGRGEGGALGQEVVDRAVVVDLHVGDGQAAEEPVIGHLPARLGVERRRVEHERRLAAVRAVRDHARRERGQGGIVVVQARRCHPARL